MNYYKGFFGSVRWAYVFARGVLSGVWCLALCLAWCSCATVGYAEVGVWCEAGGVFVVGETGARERVSFGSYDVVGGVRVFCGSNGAVVLQAMEDVRIRVNGVGASMLGGGWLVLFGGQYESLWVDFDYEPPNLRVPLVRGKCWIDDIGVGCGDTVVVFVGGVFAGVQEIGWDGSVSVCGRSLYIVRQSLRVAEWEASKRIGKGVSIVPVSFSEEFWVYSSPSLTVKKLLPTVAYSVSEVCGDGGVYPKSVTLKRANQIFDVDRNVISRIKLLPRDIVVVY